MARLGTGARSTVVVKAAAVTPTSAKVPPAGAPPAEPVEVEVTAFKSVVPGVTLVRGCTAGRLKYEVEYSLKRGTTDNCYLITGTGAPTQQGATATPVVLVDIPNEAYAAKFVDVVASQLPSLSALTHVVITHLDPKALPSLEALVSRWLAAGGKPGSLTLLLSNPALRLLQSSLGETPEKAALLSAMQLVVARSGAGLAVDESSGALVSVSTASEASENSEDSAPLLKVLLTPTPRWPDLLVVYLPGQQALLSGKLFAAHAAPGVVPDTEASTATDVGAGWEVYGGDWRYYYDCMLAPVARQVQGALDRLALVPVPPPRPRRVNKTSAYFKGLFSQFTAKLGLAPSAPSTSTASDDDAVPSAPLNVSYLLPLHGPVVVSAVQELVRDYAIWTEEQVRAASTSCVAVLYASAYGNTAALAQAISRGITKGGVAVNTLNLELSSPEEVAAAVAESDGFILGSPTLGGHMPTQVQVALGAVIRQTGAKELPCGVFGSFGWSGEAVDEMEGKLKDAGFGFAFEAVRVKFKPTAKDLQLCEESGRALAQSVKRRLKAKEVAVAPARAIAANSSQLAAGRLVGSLSVLTARDEDVTSAMLASWVSQASFNPPGVTVAVKKDRAMEPLLVVGGKFALSMLAQGKEKDVMRKLTKPFGPGEDRLAGIPIAPSPSLSLPVLEAANSWMECQVVSRMEAGDHWVVYAQVLDGKVTDESSPTAVHYRKVANHY